MLSDERRREIADFLKTRRMRRQPEELGLPRGRRRRTPGLRREEVATAAGVSAEWYTWLEQAREVRPSAQVLTRIGAALRLEPNEARHLLTLGGYAVPASGSDAPRSVSVSLRLQRLIDQMDYGPAWVFGERWDIVAWNRAASVIHGDLATLQGIERNALYQLFLGDRMRSILVDWEAHGRKCVAKLRATYASRVDDPWFNELVTLLRTRSEEFERWWNENDIETIAGGRQALRASRRPAGSCSTTACWTCWTSGCRLSGWSPTCRRRAPVPGRRWNSCSARASSSSRRRSAIERRSLLNGCVAGGVTPRVQGRPGPTARPPDSPAARASRSCEAPPRRCRDRRWGRPVPPCGESSERSPLDRRRRPSASGGARADS